ncbi:MAG: cytochrome c family protein [Proteobacteria bacterium]|nr:cytochrome c family protein [Pseudomonadota bacterium]MBU1742612.1 cytochrome c family protein [Pseudomonadota bacterium]
MTDEKQAKSFPALGWAMFGVGLVASLIVGWLAFPLVLYGSKMQPLNFNHKVHMANAENGCADCHKFRQDGTFTGVPRLGSCIKCHEEAQGSTESEKLFVKTWSQRYKKDKTVEVPWLKYYKQQPCVYFPHIAHVRLKADGGYDPVQCRACHGDHGRTTRLPSYQYNRLTTVSRNVWGYWIGGGFPLMPLNPNRRMKMMTCQNCHARGYKLVGAGGKVLVEYKPRRQDTKSCFPCHK